MSEEQNTPEVQEKPAPKVYFGVRKADRYYLPHTDEEQWIEVKTLNEGDKAQYEDAVSRKMEMDQETKKVEIKMSAGKDRRVLFEKAITRYRVYRLNNEGQPELVESTDVKDFMKTLYPEMDSNIAEELQEKIVELNGWLVSSNEGDEKKD